METNQILQGDALTKLKELPDESINCVMTSPPYWALRDYGTDVETIWDGEEDCEHDWGEKIDGKSLRGTDETPRKEVIENTKLSGSNFCKKCGAWKGQLGLEPTFDLYIKHLCDIFDEVKRVLRKDGTCCVNLGDTYSATRWTNNTDSGQPMNKFKDGHRGINPVKDTGNIQDKCLVGIPARFQIEMVNRGWILRNSIIWHKPNCMPSSVKDRFTVDFEYIFFFSKNKKYWFETQYEPHQTQENRPDGIVREREFGYDTKYPEVRGFKTKPNIEQPQTPQKHGQDINYGKQGRNKRTVWQVCPKPFKEAHFAVYPEELCETPIKAGCPEGGIILDPFFGAGTTGLVALKQNKKFIGIELNPEYIEIAKKRLKPYLEQTKLFASTRNSESEDGE